MSIDVPKQTVVSREPGDGGAEKVTTQHMDITPDLANGMILVLLTNIAPTDGKVDLPMLVAYHGVRLIHLSVTPAGTVPFRVAGTPRRGRDFNIKVELGGLTGVVAPVIGKQPKDVHVLMLEGDVPAFVREEGQLFENGPVWRIDQIGPVTH